MNKSESSKVIFNFLIMQLLHLDEARLCLSGLVIIEIVEAYIKLLSSKYELTKTTDVYISGIEIPFPLNTHAVIVKYPPSFPVLNISDPHLSIDLV